MNTTSKRSNENDEQNEENVPGPSSFKIARITTNFNKREPPSLLLKLVGMGTVTQFPIEEEVGIIRSDNYDSLILFSRDSVFLHQKPISPEFDLYRHLPT